MHRDNPLSHTLHLHLSREQQSADHKKQRAGARLQHDKKGARQCLTFTDAHQHARPHICDRPINERINQLINQYEQGMHQSTNQGADQYFAKGNPLSHACDRPISERMNERMNESINQSINPSEQGMQQPHKHRCRPIRSNTGLTASQLPIMKLIGMRLKLRADR